MQLIATLPPSHLEDTVFQIIRHSQVRGVRYNTGAKIRQSPKEVLENLARLTQSFGKDLWVDLKARQLRIARWAAPEYGKIILNHGFRVDLPAKIFFRGSEWSEIADIKGKSIWVDPLPWSAVGAGQAINVIGDNLRIRGFWDTDDLEYVEAALELGITNFMVSFIEGLPDLEEIDRRIPKDIGARIGLKIESQKGIDFVRSGAEFDRERYFLVAARDDLMINIGDNKAEMLNAQKDILARDPDAVLASRIFKGLEDIGAVGMGDFADLRLAQMMGYEYFMFSDTLCRLHFSEAIEEWMKFRELFGREGEE